MKLELSQAAFEAMRGDLDEPAQRIRSAGFGSGSDAAELRQRLDELEANASANGCRQLARCLNQIGGLAVLVDCVQDGSQGETAAVALDFAQDALQRLAATRDIQEIESAASELSERFETEFREFLGLLESGNGCEADFPDADPTPFEANHDEPGPVLGSAQLLKMFGFESATAAPTPEPTPEPAAPEPPTPCRAAPSIAIPFESDRGDRGEWDAIPAELRTVFLGEAVDLRDRIEANVLRVDRDPDDPDARRELARCFHTLKGTSASIGLASLSRRVHDLEDLLSDPACPIAGALRGRLSAELDHLDALIGGAGSTSSTTATATIQPDEPAAAVKPAEGQEPFIRIRRQQMERIQGLLADLIARRQMWTDQIDSLRDLVNAGRGMMGRFAKARTRLRERECFDHQLRERGPTSKPRSEDRAWLELVEDFNVMIASIKEIVAPLTDESNAMARLSGALWDSLQEVRIVPVAGLFRRLERVARDAARTEGRELEIVLHGESTKIDRAVQEPVFEALLHVVRNAVAHGLESASDRIGAGKPERGRVSFAARREGSALHLSIADDGRGLNYEGIASKARKLGLIGRDEAVEPSRLQQLIFSPGFSTCSEVNSLAGRGVGLDVVARTLAQLGGTIALDSTAGQGTRFHFRFPAALALEHALVVRIGGQPFALPFDVIERIEPIDPEPMDATATARPCRRIELRAALGFPDADAHSRSKLVIAMTDCERVGLVVDAIDGPRELMVQPPGSFWSAQEAITGTSTLTTGEIVLHLSISRLTADARKAIPLSTVPRAGGRTALVVDDSISVRRQGAKLLREQGFAIEEASDGMDAARLLGSRRFDLLLTDLDMPRMDGFELLGEVRRRQLPALRVIVASTRDDAETRRRVLDAGALALLGKPLTHGALSEVIANAFS